VISLLGCFCVRWCFRYVHIPLKNSQGLNFIAHIVRIVLEAAGARGDQLSDQRMPAPRPAQVHDQEPSRLVPRVGPQLGDLPKYQAQGIEQGHAECAKPFGVDGPGR
jgi:hypothetical protein